MKCKICESESINFANATVLNKHAVDYFQCQNCGFVQTEEPYWLQEAYSNAIASSDVGLVFRNTMFSKISSNIIFTLFDSAGKFLDYGGGYGLFVRQMRDLGFDFYWLDKFCENIFAKGFEAGEDGEYELVTAFELFEHFVNPIEEIEKVLKFSNSILFSTDLLPESNPKPDEWWYYSLQEGQHVSLYTSKAISIVAERFGLNFYSNGSNLHLLTAKNISPILFESLTYCEPPELKKPSLLERDYLQATGKINELNKDEVSVVTEAKNKILKIAIDGVFFQLYRTGIARVWKSLLEAWANEEFAEHIIVLDRAGTAPKIPGIKYREIPPYNYNRTSIDRELLQQICDEEQAELFISTYYTTTVSTPSVFMAYDMIPEALQGDLNEPMWREKHFAIRHASAYIAISENTARDLVKFFPDISPESVTVAHCGIDSILSPANLSEIDSFRTKYGISKPYFILVGSRSGYKNGILFFEGFSKLYSKNGFDIVCTGFDLKFEDEFRAYTSGSTVHMLTLDDAELRVAYSGAVALVFPSLYEGFGLPVLEAIACNCPVITTPNASIPEVAGEAALYVDCQDVDGMTNALCEVQKPAVRNFLIASGLSQAKKFSWSKMASQVSYALIQASLLPLNLSAVNVIIFPDWKQPESSLYPQLSAVIRAVGTHVDRSQMTLLIDTSSISEELELEADANLILSSIAMNLLMEEDIDLTDELKISLVGKLDPIQWEALLPRLHCRIILEKENEPANKENIPACGLESFNNKRVIQLETGGWVFR
ncbi:MAG TPA: glycosyl transferase group 1 [Cyanobacteria bacterium UBA11369]|nr:glycosyl transferase group 1 [Cyanobacteria bacterium UBA11371]HBE30014.1 glycosyl transferase group 1 [Cyanobacteria bacterium UBA11368]HBE48214.1 glycosyl transferase group 1 [Cyanobacteria bacterium UBA11369]